MKPKLTLRDLFWLVLVAGLALGWWLERRTMLAQLDTANENIKRLSEFATQQGWDVRTEPTGKTYPAWKWENSPGN